MHLAQASRRTVRAIFSLCNSSIHPDTADRSSQVLTVMQKYNASVVGKTLLLKVSDGEGVSGLYWFAGK